MDVRRHHKLIPTEFGRAALRARISLRETQSEFAKRFMISWITVHRWETGKIKEASPIHKHLLKTLTERLRNEGRLVQIEVFDTQYREEIERKDYLASKIEEMMK